MQLLKTSRRIAITGTTGMASLNFTDGTTLHHWAGLMDGRYDTEVLATNILYEDRYLDVGNSFTYM